MITSPINFVLTDVMDVGDNFFPISAADDARLRAHIPEGEAIILTIRDNLYSEHVRVEHQCDGGFTVVRGVDSQARRFPKGSCVFFEITVPLVKWLICNYDCCQGDCNVTPVSIETENLPTAIMGQPWQARVRVSGTPPLNITSSGAPTWVSAVYDEDSVTFSGTPPSAGGFTLSVAATNSWGREVDSATYSVNIME